jgi:uncharacterized protein
VIADIDRQALAGIRNPALRAHAARYLDIYDDFMRQVEDTGIEIAAEDDAPLATERLERLRQLGAALRNDSKSVLANAISPACVACQQGIGSATFFISLKCHRTCFYCFNPNQEGYQHFAGHQRNLPAELEQLKRSGQRINYLALTGGEPLLHKAESVSFFKAARRLFPAAHTRLYTTDDHLTPELAAELRDAGLDEVRFSIRLHDLDKGHRHTFDRIAVARAYFPSVMVEMPVLPGTQATMQAVLLELDGLGVHSINLLELCYPLNLAQAFRQRGYQVRRRPYRVLYDYWYAGGLPIAGSELACLDLVAFALERGLGMGVHYCSLENKHTGQVYQQNAGRPLPGPYTFSQRDYFLKTAKVYGPDIRKARRALRGSPAGLHQLSADGNSLALHVSQAGALRGLGLELGLSYNIMEMRAGGQVLRELKLALARPEQFEPNRDV